MSLCNVFLSEWSPALPRQIRIYIKAVTVFGICQSCKFISGSLLSFKGVILEQSKRSKIIFLFEKNKWLACFGVEGLSLYLLLLFIHVTLHYNILSPVCAGDVCPLYHVPAFVWACCSKCHPVLHVPGSPDGSESAEQTRPDTRTDPTAPSCTVTEMRTEIMARSRTSDPWEEQKCSSHGSNV